MADQTGLTDKSTVTDQTAVTVTVRYCAAARAAAGVPQEQLQVPGTSGGCTIGELLATAVERHGSGLDRVLQRCSFLLDEIAVHGPNTVISENQTVDVLPPVAGG